MRRDQPSHAASAAALPEQGSGLGVLLDLLFDPALVVDRRHRVVYANPPARTLIADASLPLPLHEVLRDPALTDALKAAFARAEPLSLEVSLPGPPLRPYALRLQRLAPERLLLLLRESGEQLALERMRADFVAHASHELRSPLATLLAGIETLAGAARDDAAAREEFLGLMRREALRMARLIDDLLTLSRIEASVANPPTERVAVDVLLAEVAARAEARAEKEDMRFQLWVRGPLPQIPGDRDQLEQLLDNLLDNAFRHGRDGRRVVLEATAFQHAPAAAGPLGGSPALRLCVRDFGAGIPAHHIPRLTERFYRVDRGRSRRAGGTGLGLAIVKHILRRHRGHLTIASREGRGSRFCAWLPVRPHVPPAVTEPSPAAATRAPD